MTQSIANVPDNVHPDQTLDCTGLLCPLPVFKAGQVLRRLQDGQVLALITTDKGALRDIPALARQRGDTLLSSEASEGKQVFLIRKGGGA